MQWTVLFTTIFIYNKSDETADFYVLTMQYRKNILSAGIVVLHALTQPTFSCMFRYIIAALPWQKLKQPRSLPPASWRLLLFSRGLIKETLGFPPNISSVLTYNITVHSRQWQKLRACNVNSDVMFYLLWQIFVTTASFGKTSNSLLAPVAVDRMLRQVKS